MSDPRIPIPLHASLQRAAFDGFLGGVDLRPGEGDSIAAVLAQDPAQLSERVLAIADLALALLPIGELSPVQKAVYGRGATRSLSTLVVNLVEALGDLGKRGVQLAVPPAELDRLRRQHGAFQSFRLLGMEMKNGVLDQRALVGACLAFLLDRIVSAVDRRFSALPDGPERRALLADFAPALLQLEDVLSRPAERKQELAAERQRLGQQVAEARADEALADTQLRLRQSLIVPRAELFAAARRHIERARPEALAEARPPGAPQAPPPGPRRIV